MIGIVHRLRLADRLFCRDDQYSGCAQANIDCFADLLGGGGSARLGAWSRESPVLRIARDMSNVVAMSNAGRKLRVLIADDSEHFRHALARALEGYCEICGEASNGLEAIEEVRMLSPDLVFLDIYMPEMLGGAAAMEIRRSSPATLIVFVSIEDDPSVAELVRGCGADGFINKCSGAMAFRDMLSVMCHRFAA